MSRADSFFAGCAGKIPYRSAAVAYRAIRNGRALKAARAYRCEFCSCWHTTRQR
jgi:hypothetical protein